MRALAVYASGFAQVTGSDLLPCQIDGVSTYTGSNPEIACAADLVVYTGAVPDTDPELLSARAAGVPVMERPRFLSLVAQGFKSLIAVAGTHGKTSTAGLIAHILNTAGVPMAAHIGGEIPDIGGSFLFSGREVFLTEACEYKRSFLSLKPTVGVITNVEFDHPDVYKNLSSVQEAFQAFAKKCKLVIAAEGAGIAGRRAVSGLRTFGYSDAADYKIYDVKGAGGKYKFKLRGQGAAVKGQRFGEFTLNVYGEYFVQNAAAAVAVCLHFGVDLKAIRSAVSTYKGAKRRFEKLGFTTSKSLLISDYAHHPDEIAASLKTAREMTSGRIILAYEPHTYSRTKKLLGAFCDSFVWADELLILPTYAAREKPDAGLPAAAIVEALQKTGRKVIYTECYQKAKSAVLELAGEGDLVLIMGAGTVEKLAAMLLQ